MDRDYASFKAKLMNAQGFGKSQRSVTLRKCLIADKDTNPIKTPKFIVVMESIEMAIRSLIQYNSRFTLIQQYLKPVQYDPKKKANDNLVEKTTEDIVLQCLKGSGVVCYAYSAASKKVIQLSDDHTSERYLVTFNPMEGNRHTLVVGFIFTVLKQSELTQRTLFRSGSEIIVAGFVLFGACVELFITIGGHNLQEFIYDEVIGEFIAHDLDAKIPVKGKFYCIDEAQSEMWDQPTFEFVTSKKNPKVCNRGKLKFHSDQTSCLPTGTLKTISPIGPPKQFRFTGSISTDMFICLKEGGILMYPKTLRSPTGTMRLLFEANPMSYIVRAAGGLATTGYASPLDVTPNSLHQTVPLYLGSREEVVDLLENVTIRIATN